MDLDAYNYSLAKEVLSLNSLFAYAHLPEHLQVRSKPFGELAQHLIDTVPLNMELVASLRSLVIAKDAAVPPRWH